LIQKNEYQHLQVAEASVYKNFVIETLLPIKKYDLFNEKEQMGLYLENLSAFTPAVKEFTGLLCQATHDDLNSHKARDILYTFSEDYTPRFDNAVLRLENGVGKIVIPDLDGLEAVAPLQPTIDDAIRFFPFHYDLIIEEAKKYYPDLNSQD